MIRDSFGVIGVIRARLNHYVSPVELGTTDPYYNIKNEKGRCATLRAGRNHLGRATSRLLEFYPHAALLDFYPSAFSSRMLPVSVLPCAVVKINLYCAHDWPDRCKFNFI